MLDRLRTLQATFAAPQADDSASDIVVTPSAGTFSDESYDFLFKVVLVGEAGVGKTSLVHRFKSGTFTEQYKSTIGVDFAMKSISVDSHSVKLQVWDTAGEERFRSISQTYYRSANAALLAYDVTDRASFDAIEHYHRDVMKYASEDVFTVLVGCKSDAAERAVTASDGRALAEKLGAHRWAETSSKEGVNVVALFEDVARHLTELQLSRELEGGTLRGAARPALTTTVRLDGDGQAGQGRKTAWQRADGAREYCSGRSSACYYAN